MRIPIPPAMATQISQIAVRHAREQIRGLGWSDRSIEAMVPMTGDGTVGIRTTLKFLMHQERGFGKFVMWWAEGRKIPIDGHVVTGKGVGTPGWVNIPSRGRVWRDVRWQHPGLQPKNFMREGLQKAIREYQPQLRGQVLRAVLGPQR